MRAVSNLMKKSRRTFLLADLSGVSDSEMEEEEADEVVVVPNESFWAMVQDRAGWLAGLLILAIHVVLHHLFWGES
jgi:hypothetical protein